MLRVSGLLRFARNDGKLCHSHENKRSVFAKQNISHVKRICEIFTCKQCGNPLFSHRELLHKKRKNPLSPSLQGVRSATKQSILYNNQKASLIIHEANFFIYMFVSIHVIFWITALTSSARNDKRNTFSELFRLCTSLNDGEREFTRFHVTARNDGWRRFLITSSRRTADIPQFAFAYMIANKYYLLFSNSIVLWRA
jgi:hypothetical protein